MLFFIRRNFYFLTEKYPYNGDFEMLASSWKHLSGKGRRLWVMHQWLESREGQMPALFYGATCIMFLGPARRRRHSKSMAGRQPNGKERTPVPPRNERWLKRWMQKIQLMQGAMALCTFVLVLISQVIFHWWYGFQNSNQLPQNATQNWQQKKCKPCCCQHDCHFTIFQ